MSRLAPTLAAVTLLTAGLMSTATAQTTPASTVHIDNCHVQSSRNAGGFTYYYYCSVVTDAAAKGTIKVTYTTSLATFNPGTPGPWRSRTGVIAFPGGGQQILSLKFGSHASLASVKKNLKVTISGASGATITDGTAVAATS